jgi:hypothetical protein
MSDVPHIFTLPSASWSDRTASPAEAADAAARTAERARQRLWAAGAAAIAWGVVGLVAGLVWFAAA